MATVKKITRKRVSRKKAGRSSAPEGQEFVVMNGPTLKTLADLREGLCSMSDEQYIFHANRSGNDFANWAEHVLEREDLAKKLRRVKTRSGAIKAVDGCM